MHSSAEESFRYAFQRDLVLLYVVTLFGWWLIGFADNIAGGYIPPGVFRPIVSTVVVLVGLAIFIGGVVSVLNQILSDLV